MVKRLLLEQRDMGAAIIMSTHQMYQVEEMCDRIVLIHQGRVVLSGDVDAIRAQFSGHAVVVRADRDLSQVPGIVNVEVQNGASHVTLKEGVSPQEILRRLVSSDVNVDRFELAVPALDEIFVRVVSGESRPSSLKVPKDG
jgi:ABC-2 type transport system ATP-binding protein